MSRKVTKKLTKLELHKQSLVDCQRNNDLIAAQKIIEQVKDRELYKPKFETIEDWISSCYEDQKHGNS